MGDKFGEVRPSAAWEKSLGDVVHTHRAFNPPVGPAEWGGSVRRRVNDRVAFGAVLHVYVMRTSMLYNQHTWEESWEAIHA